MSYFKDIKLLVIAVSVASFGTVELTAMRPVVDQASGDLVYIAGTDGRQPGTETVTGDITQQVRRTFENLKNKLKLEGIDLSHVVSVNVYLSDVRNYGPMNEVYRSFFTSDPPVRATVQADLPAQGALVQISLVAVRYGVNHKIIKPSELQSPELPYSWGVLVGDTLFISGATSRDPKTYQPKLLDMAGQTRQVLDNIGSVLKSAGMGYGDVVACKVFLDDARAFQEMNGAYRTFFPTDPPARATVRSRLMNPVFLSEIQCTAVKDSSRRVVIPEGATRSSSPLSPGIQVGNRLYLSGMTGRRPDGYAPGNVEEQTRQSLENLQATLRAAGMDLTNVQEVLIYVTDIRDAEKVLNVYRETVENKSIPLTVVGTPLMSPIALVEIMMTASN